MARSKTSMWKELGEGWNRFFFTEGRLDSLALTRILLCSVLLIPVCARWPNVREVYSSDGVVTPLANGYPGAFELPVMGGTAAVAVYTALVFFLLTSLVGWRTRLSLGIAAGLLLYFGFLDLISTLTKYTVISAHMLIVLACSRCGEVWSVDAWLKGNVAGSKAMPPRAAIWPMRVIQLFLAILYFATAVTKVKSPEFMSGEHALFWFQTNMNYWHPMGYWLSTHPQWVIVSSYIVVLWETLFIGLCWNRKTLGPLLILGALFHLGTFLLLGLLIFPLVIMSLYPVFLRPEKVRAILLRATGYLSGPAGLPVFGLTRHAWAFPLLLGVVMVTGTEAEYRLDPSGYRSAKPQLPVLDRAAVESRLETSAPRLPSEWVHRVDIGKSIVAGVVCGEERRFTPNDTVQIQLWLYSPHPDMYVHVDVHDDADLPVMQDGTPITREAHRHTVPFYFANNLRPGRYAIVIRDEAQLIARHPFEIVAE